ncbi:hypothetical protein CDAR_617411 [Caerostris darwini]|uniref:Uncharacterized protein n=1 Tax=Caerostris darwini TaxID=1538125 RepID=A0AAV4T110_9ARAC|nr:hypothetical protein CDAR_617411 [Caerostris darwini]
METVHNQPNSCPNTCDMSSKDYDPREDRYIAVVVKRNRTQIPTRLAYMVAASISKTKSAITMFRSGSIIVQAVNSFGYRTDLHTVKWSSCDGCPIFG